jgi:invasion protein IalB
MSERQGKQSGYLRTAAMAAFFLVWPAVIADPAFAQQGAPTSPDDKKPEMESRGQRNAIRQIKWGDWQKFCFKTPGTNAVCRTTISGTFDTGQTAVRADLIERQGESKARLQLFLPVGMYLPAGVKLTVDQGKPHQFPYVWCLTNTCIAANPADAALIRELEKGQKLQIEVVESSVQSFTTTLPLGPFASVRQGAPVQTFQQEIDE